ncbi:MAG: YceI family protein [Chromatiaceae bacterium]|nr:YceI family protein [Chromatiaceae bacterium]
MFRRTATAIFTALVLIAANPATAEEYQIDTKGAHASIKFKISHLGYSWLYGSFNTFKGGFSYDENNPSAASASVEIDTASVDSNHAERDKHLRSGDFLDVDKFPTASFVSTSFENQEGGNGILNGDLTLHGVTRPISIAVTHIGAGKDPWGGYRRGFSGSTKLLLTDFGITKNLGPASAQVELILDVEGIRQ